MCNGAKLFVVWRSTQPEWSLTMDRILSDLTEALIYRLSQLLLDWLRNTLETRSHRETLFYCVCIGNLVQKQLNRPSGRIWRKSFLLPREVGHLSKDEQFPKGKSLKFERGTAYVVCYQLFILICHWTDLHLRFHCREVGKIRSHLTLGHHRNQHATWQVMSSKVW